MELTSRQRLLAFALTVLGLAVLGTFLFVSGTGHHNTSGAPPRSSPTATSQSTTPPPPTQPAGSTAASSQVNIYQWLPFTEPQLAKAAALVTEFSAYYGTYSYRESAASYTGRMQGLANGQLLTVIQSGYDAPGVAALRDQQKQVSVGSAVINSLRSFGPSSLTFVVTVNQKITANGGTSQQSNQYAVTAANGGTGWQVNDIELASQGNQ
jgi:hypothetical protein